MDALVKSIRIGGDVDSIASITTGIMAGIYGLNSLPDFMLQNVEGVAYIRDVANSFKRYITNNL